MTTSTTRSGFKEEGASGWKLDIQVASISLGWNERRLARSGKKLLVDASSPAEVACVHSSHMAVSHAGGVGVAVLLPTPTLSKHVEVWSEADSVVVGPG